MKHIHDYPFDNINAVVYKKLDYFHWMFKSCAFETSKAAMKDFARTIEYNETISVETMIELFGVSFYMRDDLWYWSIISNGFNTWSECFDDLDFFFNKKMNSDNSQKLQAL